jgi:hypothetical protein
MTLPEEEIRRIVRVVEDILAPLINAKGFLTEDEMRSNGIKIIFDGRNTPKDQRQINHRRAMLLNCPAIEEAYAAEVGRRRKTGGGAAARDQNDDGAVDMAEDIEENDAEDGNDGDGDAVDSPLVPKPKRKRAPAADNTGEEGANVFKTSLKKRQANAEYKRLRREREVAAAAQQTTLPQGV